ncbi:glutathionylspermidine synthase [Ralstonia phage phiRSL1]|uniref:Glutathionylspermidine synthase n=1 Tax=Ralstonia phage phiRSL1 TaxID=1980924 RepID=B2ZXR7_9CAUD|nr:glutathionylspermidine synthase [Ralstonia phage phiRSL1]BAG41498.1 glutathionylspermidine synthase [Ralstonia phage phiRSL1]
MRRIKQVERPDRAAKLESIGLSFHSWDDYWNEGVAYEFSSAQIDELERATNELHDMCSKAIGHVLCYNRLGELGIPEAFWKPIERSFKNCDWSLYGRFDLVYDGVRPPKMLEYNADTPTSLLESAVAQWYWLQDVHPQRDQFNSIHERLVARWKQVPYVSAQTIHFASLKDNEEDWVCTHYLMDTAVQAGYKVKHVWVEDLGWREGSKYFVDLEDAPIHVLFKLYPWEWMMREEFSAHLLDTRTHLIEPMWKSVLSNKGLLAILWELYPDHPNLLPAYLGDPRTLTSYAKKPLFSREGANIELWDNDRVVAADRGPYGAEGHVYQQLAPLPNFDGNYPVIGSWIVGSEAAGICVREDNQLITTNLSHFVPHYF